MNRTEKEAWRRLGRFIARMLLGSLTARIRKDPAGYARHMAKLEMRYQAKSQRLGEVRRERRRLMHELQALKNERDLLLARLSMREPKQPAETPRAVSAE